MGHAFEHCQEKHGDWWRNTYSYGSSWMNWVECWSQAAKVTLKCSVSRFCNRLDIAANKVFKLSSLTHCRICNVILGAPGSICFRYLFKTAQPGVDSKHDLLSERATFNCPSIAQVAIPYDNFFRFKLLKVAQAQLFLTPKIAYEPFCFVPSFAAPRKVHLARSIMHSVRT